MESKMLLEEVVEILIELTDSDHLSHAMDLFNEHGFCFPQSIYLHVGGFKPHLSI